MRTHKTLLGWLFVAALVCSTPSSAQDPKSAETLPGFVHVPAGTVHPGCTFNDYKARASNADLKRALIYDVWGNVPPLPIDAFYMGKYEITNAQWKYYLDANHRVEYVTKGVETLPQLSEQFVKFRGKGSAAEWAAIYATNWKVLVAGWKKSGAWQTGWDPVDPPVDPKRDAFHIGKLLIPDGLKLVIYKHRIPPHWYGWCRIAGLRVGREYVDVRAKAADAFKVPEDKMFTELKPQPMRAKDFAHYPVRGVSPREVLAFSEWAGCTLPTEYQFERAGRGDRKNIDQHTMPGAWNNQAQWRLFAWANNKRCEWGPLPVDDESVQGGDSQFGARHMLGNVSELTRTFYDIHPKVSPAPPVPSPDLTNYALTAKGGNFGDRWQFIQLSSRTPTVGNADLDLKYSNRADSLGFRLAKNPLPGHDLMLHTILRLSYDAGASTWNSPLPHEYAMRYTAGIEQTHIVDGGAPYVHVRGQAKCVAFTPLWATSLNDKARKKADAQFKSKAKSFDGRTFQVLGALRCDIRLKGATRLPAAEAKKLLEDRKAYALALRRWKQASKKKRAEIELPPKPAEPDEYEKLTAKAIDRIGLWRGSTIEPGEWVVVYWYGFIGLANKALIMPPDAIIAIEKPRKTVKRERKPQRETTISLDEKNNRLKLRFVVEEQPVDVKKRQQPPREAESEMWALADVLPNGWLGRKPNLYSWIFDLSLPVADAAADRKAWSRNEK